MTRIGMLSRAVRRQCPRCGGHESFDGYWVLAETCPTCGMLYEREPGYWIGAMIINTAVTIGLFLVVFVGAAAALWPDVPWTLLLFGTMALNLAVPIAFYPFSKTVFVALDLSVRPLADDEAAKAARRVGSALESD